MIGPGGGGGGGGNDVKKKNIIKTYPELILCKPVGKYQFTMACIRALVMITYQVINCLISEPKQYVVDTQKNHRNEMVLLSTKLWVKSDD